MHAKLVKTDGPWLEATVDTEHGTFIAMDCISCDERAVPAPGEEFEAELDATILSEPTWDEVFGGNPEKAVGLVREAGWRYIGYGRVESIRPTLIDCSILKIRGAIPTNDDRVIGLYVRVPIDRLELYRIK
jgi:hypothetical protein